MDKHDEDRLTSRIAKCGIIRKAVFASFDFQKGKQKKTRRENSAGRHLEINAILQSARRSNDDVGRPGQVDSAIRFNTSTLLNIHPAIGRDYARRWRQRREYLLSGLKSAARADYGDYAESFTVGELHVSHLIEFVIAIYIYLVSTC